MLYLPLDYENDSTIDVLADSGVYVPAIAPSEIDRINQQASSKNFKVDDPPKFQVQVANGHLEKPIATVTLEFVIGDHSFAQHFVVLKNLTRPILVFLPRKTQ